MSEIEVLEESALAMAQSTIQNAVDAAGISRRRQAALAIKAILSGDDLSIKTMARLLAECGFEIRFSLAVRR